MKNLQPRRSDPPAVVVVIGTLIASLTWPLAGVAQDKTPDAATHKHTNQSADANNDLSAQLQELKAKTATLEAALMKRYPDAVRKDATPDKGMGKMGSGGMGMMGGQGMGMGMMGGSDDDELTEMMKTMRTMMEMRMMQMKNKNMMGGMGGGMSGMQGQDMEAMPGKGMGMMGGKGMGMMGGMSNNGMSGMQTPSVLPGFPGASHIYHIGATGFFLDHPEHIQLTSEQQTALNGIKEKSLLEQATMQRQIDEAEQELWTLTASDQPDVKKIDVKVREIENFRGDQRVAFIRAVGDSANMLTPEQRQTLVGMLPTTPAANTDHEHTP